MKLLIVRHGDPDYKIDSLTEKGWREAEYLAEKMANINVREFYVSPQGRARDTASCTMKRLNREAVVKEWLREFNVRIIRPDLGGLDHVAWDWLPEDWMAEKQFFDKDEWYIPEVLNCTAIKKEYDWVTIGFDEVMAEHGYVREGQIYRAKKPNNDTLVFFCHFGVQGVIMSHLLHISPIILWQNFCVVPTGVTTLVTEERREGIACFRLLSYASTEHLYVHAEEPSFAARFCECYANKSQRHEVFENE